VRKRLHIVVSGRVQGVFFRTTVKRIADARLLVGFVKNLSDGRVEIVAEGEEASLRALLDWCYRGSLLAHVDSLSFVWELATNRFDSFAIPREDGSLIVDKVHALAQLGRHVLVPARKPTETIAPQAPRHVVIIPDGNRRWAKERGLEPWEGHGVGMERTKELIQIAPEAGVSHMTFWGFSTENWSRPAREVKWLMETFAKALTGLGGELIKNGVSFRHLGRKDRLHSAFARGIADLEQRTSTFKDKTFSIALDYGGRDELLRAFAKVSKTDQSPNEESISSVLDTAGLPDPDLIIRTSGEQRLSGIMPWQGVYAELYFTPVHFPDFTVSEFQLALADYSSRQRRFGA